MNDRDRIELIKRISYILDSAIPIPGTKYRVGLDPIIGLIPGIGDALTSLVSSYIVLSGMQMNVSRWTLVRMVFNILIESVVGIVPVVGDVFDAYWKSNERNRVLLEANMNDPKAKAVDKIFVASVLLLLVFVLVLTGWGAIEFMKWLISQF
ncbi:MAG: DUF4112 domain-containing protein [Oligoflexus sp.]|nr:DUF4112 domain-containing protein [Oligoflexus sp.]